MTIPVKLDESVKPETVELRDGETVVGKIGNVSAATPPCPRPTGIACEVEHRPLVTAATTARLPRRS